MVEPRANRTPLRRRLAEDRPRVLDGLAIAEGARRPGQPQTHIHLVGRVHIVRVADIDRHRHRRIAQFQGLQLLLAQCRPILGRGGREVRNLHKKKWKIAHAPLPPPILNQRAEHALVKRRPRQHAVALALVPDHPPNGKRRQRRDHPVVQHPRTPAQQLRMPRKLRLRLALRLGLLALPLFVFACQHRVRFVLRHLAPGNKQRRQRRILAKSSQPRPGLGHGPPPGCVDDAHRHPLALFDLPGKIPRDGGKLARGFGS